MGEVEENEPSPVIGFPPSATELILENITTHVASVLPEKLLRLTADVGPITDAVLKKLPSSLVYLGCCSELPFERAEDWKLLPPSLSWLDVIPISYQAHCMRSPIPVSVVSSLWLPRGLTTLSLGHLESPKSEWFAHLPPNLGDFSLSATDLPKKALIKLTVSCPRLTSLSLRITANARHGWSTFVNTLPRNITSVLLQSKDANIESDVLDKHLESLPPKLQSLDLPKSPFIQGTCLPKLPPSLYICEQGNAPIWHPSYVPEQTEE
jgi:hypothetical protein